ncbi:MAG: anti-sigma factor antagonist [Candidatus Solibacter sp.]|jgi:anti-sigma B factor antagonist|nr:anti-sigma factor antagonist [Candidatus Solibacter sp.]
MEIRNYTAGGILKLHLAGRLDASSSPQLAQHLDDAVRQAHHHVRLNLSDVDFLSSAGVQTLVRYRQHLDTLHGTFEISAASDPVRKVLTLSGLDALLAAPAPAASEPRLSTCDVAGTRFDISSSTVDPALHCQVVHAARGSDRRQFSCWKNSLVVGVGALAGSTGWEHFGPVFAVGGAALCLPAGAQETPDYMVSAEAFTPELTLRTGMVCEGSLPVRANFGSELSVGELANAALEILGSDMGAMAVLGNTASGEPVMAAGIAIRTHSKLLGTLMQPLTGGQWPSGSFGGAIFSGGPVAAFDGETSAAVAGFFKGRFESRVPQRLLAGAHASAARFAEGCLFAGAISSIVGESDL